MILAIIIACEVGFWVILAAGLIARYPLRRPRLGAALLAATPVVDVILLAASVIDLRGGATASVAHGVAAVYIGVSLAFGHAMVTWADERFAHRFAGGPPPRRPPRTGVAHARQARRGWLRHLTAWAIGSALLGAAALLVADGDRTAALIDVGLTWSVVLLVHFVMSFRYSLWPRPGGVSDSVGDA